MTTEAAKGDPEKRMPFLAHLDDLRSALRNSAIAVLLCTVVAYVFRWQLFALWVKPLSEAWQDTKYTAKLGNAALNMFDLLDSFMVPLKLSIVAGVVVASPIIFREIWRFISPGLYPRERRWGMAFVVSSVLLFGCGVAFCYIFVLPAGYKFFLSFTGENMGRMTEIFGKSVNFQMGGQFSVNATLGLAPYFELTTTLLLVFGAAFELPILLSVLAMLGVVSAKGLWKFNRYAVVVFAIVGAVLTPGDLVIGQLAMAGSLTILYNLSIILALFVGRKRKVEDEAPPPQAS